jgi:hypothetical protein
MMRSAWKDVVELLVSVYIFISPFILGFFDLSQASTTFLLVGTAAILISQLGIAKQQPWEEWVNLLLGAFLAVSPWLFGYSQVALVTINAVAAGIVLAVFALTAMIQEYIVLHRQKHEHPTGHIGRGAV